MAVKTEREREYLIYHDALIHHSNKIQKHVDVFCVAAAEYTGEITLLQPTLGSAGVSH